MLEILHCKHPPKTSSISASPSSSITLDLQYHTVESEVLKAIRSFPSGSGGGLDELRRQRLKDLVGGGNREHESSLLKSLTLFVNLVLAGGVPAEIRPIFFGASPCGLRKKDGGIHPIAIGNTLRCLISKVAVRGCSERCSNLLKPNQLGFGVRMGAEAAIHATHSFIESHRQNTILLKIDFTNAFNSIHRDKALEAVSEHLPACLIMFSPLTEHLLFIIRRLSASLRRCPARRSFGSSPFLSSNSSHCQGSLFSTQYVVP